MVVVVVVVVVDGRREKESDLGVARGSIWVSTTYILTRVKNKNKKVIMTTGVI